MINMNLLKFFIVSIIIVFIVSCTDTKKEIRREINSGIKENSNSRFKEAIVHYQAAIDMDSQNAEAYLNMGNSYFNLRNFDKSLECANKAIELNNTYGAAYKLRAELYKKIFKNNTKACENYLLAEKYGVKNLQDYTKHCR